MTLFLVDPRSAWHLAQMEITVLSNTLTIIILLFSLILNSDPNLFENYQLNWLMNFLQQIEQRPHDKSRPSHIDTQIIKSPNCVATRLQLVEDLVVTVAAQLALKQTHHDIGLR
jgi:hypothetical protein